MLKVQPRATFERCRQLGALYTGGARVQLTADARGRRLLVTAAGEDVLVTDAETGERVFTLSGVCDYFGDNFRG